MPYPTRSEEFYSPGTFQPQAISNADTLGLMREAKARNLQQKGQIGDLTAESIREPAADMAGTIKALPGAFAQGQEMRRSGEKHQMGAEEHQQGMALGQQQMAGNAQNMERARRTMDDEQRRRAFMQGGSEEQMWKNEVEAGGLANQTARSGLAMNAAQLAQLKAAQEKQDIEDQAKVASFWQSKGNAPTPQRGTPEFKKALVDAGAAGLTKSGQQAENTIYNSSPEGVLTQQKMVDVNRKAAALRDLADAETEYNRTTDNPLGDKAAKERVLAKANAALQELGLPSVGGWGGDFTPTFVSNQISKALDAGASDLKNKLRDVHATKGAGSVSLNQVLAQHENTINYVTNRKARALEDSKDRVRRLVLSQSSPSSPNAPAIGGVQNAGGQQRRPSKFEQMQQR